ncbi:MAG: folate-binding protein YgfZ [Betaproteobacteria bacterium]|nr:folate-binding protein YgfZ [Betaproteobacteria bacterium]
MRRQGGVVGDSAVQSFGDLPAELVAARDGCVAVPLLHLGLIRASGEDAAAFLHNLLSNDIRSLAGDAAQYSSLCTGKGRMLANFIVWRDGDDFLLALSADLHAVILRKLSMYVLRSKVKLTDASEETALFGMAGAEAATLLTGAGMPVPPALMGVTHCPAGTILRQAAERFLVAVPAELAAAAWETLSATPARPAGTPAWTWLEVRDGVPLITAATQEEFVPQMVNFELIGGISFRKGCYPGQEVVARTHYLGKVKRRMFLIHLGNGKLPAPGDALHCSDMPEQPCGRVVNAAPAPGGGCDVLAVLYSTSAEAGDIHLGAPDGHRLEVRALPYPIP